VYFIIYPQLPLGRIQYCEVNMYTVVGKDSGGAIRPFDKANITTIQTIFYSGLCCLFLIFEPVKVQVKYFFVGAMITVTIFIYYGKGRTRHMLCYSFCFT